MAYCPKCGTATNQPHVQQKNYEDDARIIRTVGFAVIGVVVAIAVIVVALLAVGVLPGSPSPFGQIGSGHVTTQQFNLTDFSAVTASHGFNVQITQGTTYSVKVTTDDNLQQYIDVRKEGNTLYVGLKPGMGFSSTQLKAEITLPTIKNLQLSGGTILNAQNVNIQDKLTIDISGGSQVTLTGQATDLTLRGSGGSIMHLGDLQANNATVDYSGGSQGTVNLNGRLDVTLSGGSQLHYKGNPTLGRVDSTGGSTITPAT